MPALLGHGPSTQRNVIWQAASGRSQAPAAGASNANCCSSHPGRSSRLSRAGNRASASRTATQGTRPDGGLSWGYTEVNTHRGIRMVSSRTAGQQRGAAQGPAPALGGVTALTTPPLFSTGATPQGMHRRGLMARACVARACGSRTAHIWKTGPRLSDVFHLANGRRRPKGTAGYSDIFKITAGRVSFE